MSPSLFALLVIAGIVVALGVTVAIGQLFFNSVNEVAKSSKGLARYLRDTLGRKALRRRAEIPSELAPEYNPWPEGDPERVALESYQAHAPPIPTPKVEMYVSEVAPILAATPSFKATKEIRIDQVDDVLYLPSTRAYEFLFEPLAKESKYPVPAPLVPAEPRRPPKWAPRNLPLSEPSLALPYYQSGPKLLNRLVDAAYWDQAQQLGHARRRKSELEEIQERRNRSVEALDFGAAIAWAKVRDKQASEFLAAQNAHKAAATAYINSMNAEKALLQTWQDAANQPGALGLLCRIDLTLRTRLLPPYVSREGQSRFDAESGVLIHEHRFPDLQSLSWHKYVALKSGVNLKPANVREKKEAATKLWPALCLRLACELAALDNDGIIKAIAINGWADYVDRATGQEKRAYCASLFALKDQIAELQLSNLEPVAAFKRLKGQASLGTLDIVPIAPTIRLDMEDPRFIDPKIVLEKMSEGTNLALMDWEDFEHLCRELFERAFADSGAEVKVTQASRDQGVDAVIFDPDPLRGGKIVVQAKRYTNTVDVSAVRELYGAVINEGATKGILVTTSQYGPDAYAFAKDKPLTLLHGGELLSLLGKYGYKFTINLAEARQMM